MRIIITGSKNIENELHVRNAIIMSPFAKDLSEIICLCSCKIDFFAKNYAYTKGIKVSLWHTDWERYKQEALIKRNEFASQYTDGLILIWDGYSKEINHILKSVRSSGKPICIYQLCVMKKSGTVINYPKDNALLTRFNNLLYAEQHRLVKTGRIIDI